MVCSRMAAEVRVVGREEQFGDLQMEEREIEDLQTEEKEIEDLQMEEGEVEEVQMENHGVECSHVEESQLEELQMDVTQNDEEGCEEPSGAPQTEQVRLTIVLQIVPTVALFVIMRHMR